MLKRKITPLNIREMVDSEAAYKKEKALRDFISFWEEHGSILLTQEFFSSLEKFYNKAKKQIELLEWLDGAQA